MKMKNTKSVAHSFSNGRLIFMVLLAFALLLLCILSIKSFPSQSPSVSTPPVLQEQTFCSIADIAYDNIRSDNINDCTVYINENDVLTPFIVLTDNYYGSVLLLRKETLEQPMRINEKTSYYENSEIDTLLNNQYLDCFTEKMQAKITMVPVQIAADDAIGACGADSTAILRKFFLLSYNEVVGEGVCAATEGQQLQFFMKSDNRIAQYGGKAVSWSLRSPNTYYTSQSYCIGPDGKIGSGNAFDVNGIRPAFCIARNISVTLRDDVIEDQECWVLE